MLSHRTLPRLAPTRTFERQRPRAVSAGIECPQCAWRISLRKLKDRPGPSRCPRCGNFSLELDEDTKPYVPDLSPQPPNAGTKCIPLMNLLAKLPKSPGTARVSELAHDLNHKDVLILRMLRRLKVFGYPVCMDANVRSAWLHGPGIERAIADAQAHVHDHG